MKYRVGIDCDQVLRDWVTGVKAAASFYWGIELGDDVFTDHKQIYQIKTPDGSLGSQIFGARPVAWKVFFDAPPMKDALQAYKLFVEDRHFEVFIITNQNEMTAEITSKWLLANGMDRHVGTIYTQDKLRHPIHIMIDDNPKIIQQYRSAMRSGILIRAPHNKEFNTPPVTETLLSAYYKCADMMRNNGF